MALNFLLVGIPERSDCVGCAAKFIFFWEQEGCPCIAWHRWSQLNKHQEISHLTSHSLSLSSSHATPLARCSHYKMQLPWSQLSPVLRRRPENGAVKSKCQLFLFALSWFYSSAVLAWPGDQLLQSANCSPKKLLCKGTEVSSKIMCLVLTLIFPRNIHPFQKKWSLTAHTVWILSAVLVTLVCPFSPSRA